jgi:peptidoglycan/LPS O-acetylase OafA/YrhL
MGRHLPALDGLRAVAIAGVLAYHLGLPGFGGGYLGVDLFFVLSGFLITSLLLEGFVVTGSLGLAGFWTRRAKRLLPALFLVLLALAAWVGLSAHTSVGSGGPPVDLSSFRADALAALFYVANWHELLAHQAYFAQFSLPSPLQHAWSLAIEEQFYLCWPLLLVVLGFRRQARTGRPDPTVRRTAPVTAASCGSEPDPLGALRRRVLTASVVGATCSAAWMAWLASHGASINRVYLGTDTRAFELLAGAVVAACVAARPDPKPRIRRRLHVLGCVATAGLAALWAAAGGPPRWIFVVGLQLAALCAATLVADVRQGDLGLVGRVLATPPLRFLGRISYGVYLWHWPVFVFLTVQRTGWPSAVVDFARLATTLGLATASFFLVEQPIRRARLRPRQAAYGGLLGAGIVASSVLAAALPAAALGSAGTPAARQATLAKGFPAGRALLGVPGAGGLANDQPVRLRPPVRILVLGDSVMNLEAPALAAALDSTGAAVVVDRAIDGFGLTTARNWRQAVPSILHAIEPQVVLAMWQFDDAVALAHPRAYEHLLGEFASTVLAPGTGVRVLAFEQYPPLGPLWSLVNDAAAQDRERAEGVAAWNRAASAVAAEMPQRVIFLPTAASLELHGRYATWLPPLGDPRAPKREWQRVRMIDNTHLCPAGAARVAAALAVDFHLLFGIPLPRPGWQDAPWSRSTLYSSYLGQPNTCPSDHPPA